MSGTRKYSDEFRLQIIQEYLDGNSGGFRTLAKKYGISMGDIRFWVNSYKNVGEERFCNVPFTYDGAFKIHVVEYMHHNSLSLSQAAEKFGIRSRSTLRKWERIYYEEGKEALMEELRGRSKKMSTAMKGRPPKKDVNENEDLLEEVQRLRMENEYLKKLIALTQERERQERKTK